MISALGWPLKLTLESPRDHAHAGPSDLVCRPLSPRASSRGAPYEATGICHDSRKVKPGAVFVAIHGLALDGNTFIADAIERGARYVIVQEDLAEVVAAVRQRGRRRSSPCRMRASRSPRRRPGSTDIPRARLGMIGVTGTDGKTTTTHLIAHILNATGLRAGYLSSVEFGVGGASR